MTYKVPDFRILILILAVWPAAAFSQIQYYVLDPVVISTKVEESTTLEVQTDGSPSALELVLAGGDERDLVNEGNGLFTTIISHAEALYDYQDDDVYRNFVGYIDVYSGATRLGRYNLFVNVHEESIPTVPIIDVNPELRVAPHVANVHWPGANPSSVAFTAVGKKFYEYFADEFDFINVVWTPSRFSNRFFLGVQNYVTGTGVGIFDSTANYGSSGRLLGMVNFPITAFFDLASRTYSHELGHHWINFGHSPKLLGYKPHWPVSSLANSVMGYQSVISQGLTFNFSIRSIGGDRYQLDWNPESSMYFNDMEMYLMGMAPAASVGSHIVFENQDQNLCIGCILEGPVLDFDVNDAIESDGPRDPAYPDDQVDFRAATVVVSGTRPLSDREMMFFDHFAARGEATDILPFASGLAKGVTAPFRLSTHGVGSLSTEISNDLLPRTFSINPGIDDAWFNKATDGQGFFIIVFEEAGIVFLAWFTYDTARPPEDVMASLGEPGHRWLTAQGPFEGDTATLDVTLTSGGIFDSSEPEPENTGPIGTITIVWHDCSSATLFYDINPPGVMGEMPLRRIVPDNEVLCEALSE